MRSQRTFRPPPRRRRPGFPLPPGMGVLVLCGAVLALAWAMERVHAGAHDEKEERMLRDFGLLTEAPELPPVGAEFRGDPVRVVLAVDRERRIAFEQPFRLGIEPVVAGHFAIEIFDRHLLIRALRPVSTRVRVQLASGTVVPLDVHAITGAGPAGPLEITVAKRESEDPTQFEPTVPPEALPRPAPGPDYIDLVRHAARQFHGPERLRGERPGLQHVPVTREPLRLIRGAALETAALAGWQEGGLTVTAVGIRNPGAGRIRLDPRQVLGRWRAAAFLKSLLRPGESTVLLLVSDAPFETSLGIHGLHLQAARAGRPEKKDQEEGGGGR